MDVTFALGVFMRSVHMLTVILLIGGVFYARAAGSEIASSFASKIYWLTGALVVSGLYNFLTKPAYPPHYHMWFGIKILFALHVISMLILLTRRNISGFKQRRWMTSIQYSATAVVILSAILRWLTLNPGARLP